MRICITTITTTDKFTGIAFYLQKLIKYLQKIDDKNDYIIITTVDNSAFFQIESPNFKEIKLPLNQKTFFSRICLHVFNILFFPLLLLFYRVRVVHYPNTMFINRFFSKTVVTIHDIVDQKVNKYGKWRMLYREMLVKRALKYGSEVITVSENSKKDLIKLYDREIHMIYNGYDKMVIPEKLCTKGILDKYDICPQKYLITIGTLLKHKNIPRLVRVYALYQNKYRTAPFNKLLILGHKENDYESIIKEIERCSVQHQVKVLDYVGDYEKKVLLKNAFAFVFFSLYEGFGFPILEAQELEVPVIYLNTSCLKEVSGEYALAIPNYDTDDQILNIFDEHCKKLANAAFRERFVKSATNNLNRFNWLECAKKTHELYEKLA